MQNPPNSLPESHHARVETDHDAPQSDRRTLVVGLAQLVFVIAVIAAAVGFSSALKGKETANRPQLSDLRGATEIAVRVTQPEQLSYAPRVHVNGTVQASAEISVSPQVTGEITRVSNRFRAGSEIKRGELLFEIDRADFELTVERAEAEIAAARSDLAQLRAEAQLAIQEWQELYPGREVNALAAREPQIAAAEARVNSAVANQRAAELSLQRTRVYAPVDARVISSNLDIGQIVAPGQSVGRLVSLESIELVVPVSQAQQSVLEPIIGSMADFKRRGAAATPQSASVVRVDASLDSRTRLSNLFLRPEDQSGLRIGDFIDVTFTADPIPESMVVPTTSFTGQDQIWVVEDQKLSQRQIVRLGEQGNGQEVIVAPFEFGDGVVVLPPLEGKEGQQVTIRNEVRASTSLGGLGDGSR
jgi:RND family efflux transporter MFP subunit